MTSVRAQSSGRVLVVDDNQVNRKLLTQQLNRQGHTVQLAVDGEAALEELRAQPFDLVLLDLEMPRKDGLLTLTEMKGDPALRHIPVIMITAVDEIETTVRCIEIGAEDYLPKPFNPVLLRARIDASLEKKRLRDAEQLYLKGLERELEIAREIQRGFLPDVLPQVAGWEIASYFRAAREVAGDFYDAFLLPDGNLGLVVADVCDKGVGAALFMTLFRSLIRAASTRAEFMSVDDSGSHGSVEVRLKHAVSLTNNYIAETHGNTGMFATMFVAALRPDDGGLAYINGGQESALIIRDGKVIRELPTTGPAVGVMPNFDYRVERAHVDPGDLLAVFTDGAPDTKDPAGVFFGRKQLNALLCRQHDSTSGLLEMVGNALQKHMAGANQFDDITLLAVRRTSS